MADQRWFCSVCGYIHAGPVAPNCCPVCGVPADLFEPAPEPKPAAAQASPRRWRCINCDFIHDGDKPPDSCLICGVGPDQFEPVAEPVQALQQQGFNGSIVIIGGGIAGVSAAEAARAHAPDARITLVSQEPDLPYYRLNLTRYLAGEIGVDTLPVHPADWYAQQGIELLLGVEVTAIDRAGKCLSLKGRSPLTYDRLVLATGAHPSVPPISGVHRKRVVTLRNCRDAETILDCCPEGSRCVVIGGGVLGLEVAGALALRKLQVTLLEGFDWLLPRQLNRAAGERLAQEARALGITLLCGVKIKELDGDEQVRSVVLESGQVVPADLVIITAGVRSNSYLARLAGLEVNSGVVVDHYLRTSDPAIYAAGDSSEFQGMIYGTWAPAQSQGTVVGSNAAGQELIFDGIPRSNSIKVIGADLFSIGQIHPDDASYQVFEETGQEYSFFVFRDSLLKGAILIGDTSSASTIKKLIENQRSCTDLLATAGSAAAIKAALAAGVP